MKLTQNPLDFRHFEPDEYSEQKVFEGINRRFNRVRQCYGMKEDQWPLCTETPDQYRVRLMRGLQEHTTIPNDNLLALRDDPGALDSMEKRVIADAIANVADEGRLAEVTFRDATGREISEFEGSLGSWFGQFKGPVLKMTKLNGRAIPIIPLK